jgi:Ser/Thr protein kinase RdoA (MazF antagonist)
LSAIGAGRASTVYDLGDGTVLRRQTERPADLEREASVMRYARARGYPVPEVVAVRRDGLVLERIEGPTMLADIRRRPWRMREHVRVLAALQKRLHLIEAPPGLRRAGDGTQLIHLDFHPDNVLLGRDGPAVIDWSNAMRGAADGDIARTLVILRHGAVLENTSRSTRALVRTGRRLFVKAYLRAYAEHRPVRPESLRPWEIAHVAARIADGIEAEREALLAVLERRYRAR